MRSVYRHQIARLERELAEVEQQIQALSQTEVANVARFIEWQIATLEAKHGKFDKETRELLAFYAGGFADSDPMNAINRGYDAMLAENPRSLPARQRTEEKP